MFRVFFPPLRNRHHVVRLHAPQAVSFRTYFFPLSLGEMDYLSFIFHYGTKIKQYSLNFFSSLERFGSPVSRTAIQDIKCTGCVLSRACFLRLACFPTFKLLPCVQTDEWLFLFQSCEWRRLEEPRQQVTLQTFIAAEPQTLTFFNDQELQQMVVWSIARVVKVAAVQWCCKIVRW